MAQLLQRIYLRYHARLILAIVLLCGFLSSHFLLNYADVSMPFRYPLVAFISYVVFVILMQLWKFYLEGLPPIQIQKSETIQVKKERRWRDYLDTEDSAFDSDFGEAAISFLVIGLFAVLIYGSSYILFEIPVLMIEVVLSGLTTSLFHKKIKKADDDIFVFKVVRQTLSIGILVIVIYFILGVSLYAGCPGINKLSDVVTQGCSVIVRDLLFVMF